MNKLIAIISKSDNICKNVTILQEVPAEDSCNLYTEVTDTDYTGRAYVDGVWSDDVKIISGGGTDMLSLGDIGKIKEEITDDMTAMLEKIMNKKNNPSVRLVGFEDIIQQGSIPQTNIVGGDLKVIKNTWQTLFDIQKKGLFYGTGTLFSTGVFGNIGKFASEISLELELDIGYATITSLPMIISSFGWGSHSGASLTVRTDANATMNISRGSGNVHISLREPLEVDRFVLRYRINVEGWKDVPSAYSDPVFYYMTNSFTIVGG